MTLTDNCDDEILQILQTAGFVSTGGVAVCCALAGVADRSADQKAAHGQYRVSSNAPKELDVGVYTHLFTQKS